MTIGTPNHFLKGVAIVMLAALMLFVATLLTFLESELSSNPRYTQIVGRDEMFKKKAAA